jgi:hypothetical protein
MTPHPWLGTAAWALWQAWLWTVRVIDRMHGAAGWSW